jgi:hypothetical protein
MLSALIALLAVATAAADDAAVVSAYNAHKGELHRAVKAYNHAARKAARTQKRRWFRRTIRADKRINRVLARQAAAMADQQPSSDTGRRGQRCAIAETRYWRKANRVEIASIRAFLNGHRHRADRLLARANRIMKRKTAPKDRCRRRAFKKIPPPQ